MITGESNQEKNITGRIERIALSLSGGGVRAAGFHHGTICMLERLGLLEKVRIISSAGLRHISRLQHPADPQSFVLSANNS